MKEFDHEYDLGKAVLITPKKRDFKMLVTPRYVGHYYENVYEEFTADLLSNIIRDHTCFIDIGAHSGFYTLLVGTKYKNTQIIAFEPVPENFSLLAKNLELNGLKNIRACNLAVSDRDETKIFNITEASDSAGFYQHPLTGTIKTMEVKTVVLDNFLKDLGGLPIVVKIDTEGHELHVLDGMRRIIEATEDIRLVVEFNPSCLSSGGCQPKSLLEKIDELGFEIFFINDECGQTYKLGENLDRWASLIADKIYLNLLCIKKQKSLSVCFFSHSSYLLGAERSLLELTSELVRNHGVICSVVLPDDGPLRQELEKVGASTLVIDYSWWCDWSLPTDEEIISRLTNSFKAVLDQIGTVRKINPDVVFTNTLVIPWGAITASFLGRPHVWFIHEFGKLDYSFRFYLSFRKALQFIKDSSNIIFTNSKAVRKALFGEISGENVLTIYYNIEIPADAHNQGDRLNYFTRPEATKLVITGSITETKGQEDAIWAVKELIEKKKDVELVIMGPSSPHYLKELKEIVGDENLKGHVHFHGFEENPYPVLNQADIVLLCSEREAFGRVTVEGMLLKKAVIGTNSGATPELIREGYNGLLYEPGDYRQLADKIEYLIGHREKIIEFGENGFEFAKTTFTKEKYGGEVYRRLTDLRSASNLASSPFFSFVTKHLLSLQASAEAQRVMLAQKEEEISQFQATIRSQQEALAQREEEITRSAGERQKLADDLVQIQAAQENLDREIIALRATVQQQQQALSQIYDSHGWKALSAYYDVRNQLVPEGTWRRAFAKRVFHGVLNLKRRVSQQGQLVSSPADPQEEHNQEVVTREKDQELTTIGSIREGSNWEAYEYLSAQISALRQGQLERLSLKAPKMIRIEEKNLSTHAKSLVFTANDSVQVSIVIPVYNNLKFTLECLTSVMEHSSGVAYEVIVVDDGSSDQTPEILSLVPNITYIRNEENLGFIRTCNRGAEIARGKHILFLNNDAQVTENWLQPLIQTFGEYDNVGAVGPKIVFPDGRLQEAGALVNRDGTSRLIGLFDDPDLPRYNYVREVMYCSGACLLVDGNKFKELGGFDVSLAPGYCEDWDLAFRLREHGLRVMYNPKSVIIHHLSATSNSVDESFKLSCVVRNQQKLSEKWQRKIDGLNEIRSIALYLPQFHPIPENDVWWEKGFTEWTNVSKAMPNFVGHYQPHLPADLGFYDLRVEEIMEQQAELAKRYRIYGFCYFYYWFAGKRLLDLPLERLLRTNRPNIPFCLCWANENWTRRWDGREQEVLIGQQHSDEDDAAIICDLMRYMRHPLYIRINGKPLLIVYRINLFPDIKRTTEIWRDFCRREGVGEIYLAMVESFEFAMLFDHPSKYGFDASIEFPPHGMDAPISPPGAILNPDFTGIIHDYREVIFKYLQVEDPGYVRFRSVMPSWDNTPRRQNDSLMFANACPEAYQAWLEAILEQTHEQNFGDERIVFINAWNEWGEGNYLEPDRKYGHRFLEATRNAQDRWLLKRENSLD